jgi:hypothetical protein
MFLWGIDDVCDAVVDRLTDREIGSYLDRYHATTEEPESVVWSNDRPAEIVGAAWQDVIRALGQAEGPSPYYRLFSRADRDTCERLKVELSWKRRWQTEGVLPTFAEYLDNAQVTSLGPLVVLSLLVIMASRSEPLVPDAAIERVVFESGMCLRTINDVRSRGAHGQVGRVGSKRGAAVALYRRLLSDDRVSPLRRSRFAAPGQVVGHSRRPHAYSPVEDGLLQAAPTLGAEQRVRPA